MLTPRKKALKRALEKAKESDMDFKSEEGVELESFKSREKKEEKPPIEFKGTYYSPDKNYKTKVKKRYGEEATSKETRTFKGIINKAPKPKLKKQENNINTYNV